MSVICLFVCLFVCRSVSLSVFLSVCLSVLLFVDLTFLSGTRWIGRGFQWCESFKFTINILTKVHVSSQKFIIGTPPPSVILALLFAGYVCQSRPSVTSFSHVRQSCPSVMSVSHVRQSCPSVMSVSLVRQSCPSVLSVSLVRQSCRSVLSVSHVRQSCQTVMNLSVMDPSVTDLSVMDPSVTDLSVMVPCQSGLPLFAVCVDRMTGRATSIRQYRLTSRSIFTRLTNQQIDEQAGKHTDPQIHRETNKLMFDSHTPIDR